MRVYNASHSPRASLPDFQRLVKPFARPQKLLKPLGGYLEGAKVYIINSIRCFWVIVRQKINDRNFIFFIEFSRITLNPNPEIDPSIGVFARLTNYIRASRV